MSTDPGLYDSCEPVCPMEVILEDLREVVDATLSKNDGKFQIAEQREGSRSCNGRVGMGHELGTMAVVMSRGPSTVYKD